MIKSLYLAGFKSFGKPVQIDFRDITLLYGENSSGKSTVLQALHYAREVFCRGNLNCLTTEIGGDFIDLRGFSNFVHRRNPGGEVVLGVKIDISGDEFSDDFRFPGIEALVNTFIPWRLHEGMTQALQEAEENARQGQKGDSIHLELGDSIETVEVRMHIFFDPASSTVDISAFHVLADDNHVFSLEVASDTRHQRVKINFEHPYFPDKLGDGTEGWKQRLAGYESNYADQPTVGDYNEKLMSLLLKPVSDSLNWLEDVFAWVRDPSGDDQHKDYAIAAFYACAAFVSFSERIRSELEGVLYLGPLRRHYTPQRIEESKKRCWSDGLGAWDELATSSEQVLEHVNEWLRDEMRFNFDCSCVKKSTRVQAVQDSLYEQKPDAVDDLKRLLADLRVPEQVLLYTSDGICLTSKDLGVGFSQVLPVVVAAVGIKSGCVLLEQPELHIHVRLQAVVGDLLAQGIRRGGNRQFIIETHSEALLLRLMRRIRETTKEIVSNGPRLLCDNVAVYHISKKDGNSIAKKIELDTYGNLTDEWPDDLFEVSFKERFGE